MTDSSTSETVPKKWDPARVEALINDCHRKGETPVVLCVGHREAAALRSYLSDFFEDEQIVSLKNQVYAGLKIVELRVDTLLRVETVHTLYKDSRHETQKKLHQQKDANRVAPVLPKFRPKDRLG